MKPVLLLWYTKTRVSSTCSPAVEPRGRRFAGEPDGPVGPQWLAHGGQAALRRANTVAAAPPYWSARQRRRSIRLRGMQLQSWYPSSIERDRKTIQQKQLCKETQMLRRK
jgi:hypothetical protein